MVDIFWLSIFLLTVIFMMPRPSVFRLFTSEADGSHPIHNRHLLQLVADGGVRLSGATLMRT